MHTPLVAVLKISSCRCISGISVRALACLHIMLHIPGWYSLCVDSFFLKCFAVWLTYGWEVVFDRLAYIHTWGGSPCLGFLPPLHLSLLHPQLCSLLCLCPADHQGQTEPAVAVLRWLELLGHLVWPLLGVVALLSHAWVDSCKCSLGVNAEHTSDFVSLLGLDEVEPMSMPASSTLYTMYASAQV